jgi:hypothetical protein
MNKMRTIIILTALVFLSMCRPVFAQKSSDCKFEIDNTDANTGKPVRKIKTKLTSSDMSFIIISRNDTTYKLILNLWISGAIQTIITKDEVANIKMSGGTFLKLKTSSASKPIPHYSDQTWTEYSPEYPIRSADLAKMKTITPINLKLNVGDEIVFWEFTTKDLEKIKDMIRCIMK